MTGWRATGGGEGRWHFKAGKSEGEAVECRPTMLWLYRTLFLPVLLVLLPRYLLRMRRRGGYREKFGQRFGAHEGLPAKRPGVRRIWLQAVSVGEVLAIAPLIEALLKAGGVEIYLTTTTSTGFRVADERYYGRVHGPGYFPIDWWPCARRAWRAIEPDLAILTEGERWPEHIHQANTRGVPVIAINARLSDRSFARMRRFRFAAPAMLAGIARLLPCSAQDEARFRELGFPADRIFTTGNIKLDLQIPLLSEAARMELRQSLGLPEGPVLLGSSTWDGEEEALLKAWRAARAAGLRCGLLLVPRHAERRNDLKRLLQNAGVSHHFRSQGRAPAPVEVAVGDTTGELRMLTQIADLVFIGKSLPPNEGGQTPVEAAALEKPILFGPAMGNFRQIAQELVARGATRVVADEAALVAVVHTLLADPAQREAMAATAVRWQRENAGAVGRTLTAIREELAKLA